MTPGLQEDWELHLGLTVPAAAGAAEELPGALGWHPNQGAVTSTT